MKATLFLSRVTRPLAGATSPMIIRQVLKAGFECVGRAPRHAFKLRRYDTAPQFGPQARHGANVLGVVPKMKCYLNKPGLCLDFLQFECDSQRHFPFPLRCWPDLCRSAYSLARMVSKGRSLKEERAADVSGRVRNTQDTMRVVGSGIYHIVGLTTGSAERDLVTKHAGKNTR